jgi:hypothetical protein
LRPYNILCSCQRFVLSLKKAHCNVDLNCL